MTNSVFRHDGLDLSVVETGTGRPFVFQHGLCGAASQPAEVFPHHIGWQCLTLECRGHGRSTAGDLRQLSIASFTNDLAALIRGRNLGPVVVGGISMGAAISLRLAATQPDLVCGLVLARPAWVNANRPANMAPNAEVGELLLEYPAPEARRRFEQSATARRLAVEAPDNLASLLGFFQREPIAVTAALLCHVSADGPGISRAAIAKIKVPALVVGHARDAVHPLPMAEDLVDLIPQARLAVIAPKADGVAAYQSDFRAALSGFLKEF